MSDRYVKTTRRTDVCECEHDVQEYAIIDQLYDLATNEACPEIERIFTLVNIRDHLNRFMDNIA